MGKKSRDSDEGSDGFVRSAQGFPALSRAVGDTKCWGEVDG
jgi:hypothetical protein